MAQLEYDTWAAYVRERLAPLGEAEVKRGVAALNSTRDGSMLPRVAAFAILDGAGVLTDGEWNAGLLTLSNE